MSGDTEFLDAVRGKYKLSDHISSASFWVPKTNEPITNKDGETIPAFPNVPRPYLNLNSLRWLSIFGLDHLYLRSPGTGFLKLIFTWAGILTIGSGTAAMNVTEIIGGVLLSLWWLWDILQLFLEGGRVVNYGMTMPFDWSTGLGQGMITDDKTFYKQENSYMGWLIGVIFGFTGLDMFFGGNPGVFMRKLLIFIAFVISIGLMWVSSDHWNNYGTAFWATFGSFAWFMIPAIALFAVGILPLWVSTMYSVFADSDSLKEDGLKVPKSLNFILGWWKGLYTGEHDTEDYRFLEKSFDIRSMSAEELAEIFRISYGSYDTREEEKESYMASQQMVILVKLITVAIGLFIKWPFTEAAKAWNKLTCNLRDNGWWPNPSSSPPSAPPQTGGSRAKQAPTENLSTEAQVLGAAILAIIAGGSLKGLVDYLMV